jgi:adiponectin receptor
MIPAKLDYTGIALMILVSFFPFMYNLFYCHPWLAIIYTTAISVLVIAAIWISWSPSFNLPHYNKVRAGK